MTAPAWLFTLHPLASN